MLTLAGSRAREALRERVFERLAGEFGRTLDYALASTINGITAGLRNTG